MGRRKKPKKETRRRDTGPTTVVPRPAVEPEPTPEPAPISELPEVVMVKPVRIVKEVEHYADPKLKRYPIDTPGQVDNAYGLVTSETSSDRALWGLGYMNKMADVIRARARALRLVRTWAPR